jgi:predicted phage terminase large subunit-like protein
VKWTYVRFPAIADENEDRSDPTGRKPGELLSSLKSHKFLQEIEAQNPQVYLGQFQGRPRRPGGTIIQRPWLKEVEWKLVPRLALWVRFWDLNSMRARKKNDWTAGCLLGVGPDGTLYIADISRFRAEWPEARELIEKGAIADLDWCNSLGDDERFDPPRYELGIEDVFWQSSMIQDLQSRPVFDPERGLNIWPVKADADKKIRASGWIARAKFNQLRLIKGAGEFGSWQQEFINECLAFDGLELTNDDQVDAVSGAYKIVSELRGDLIDEHKEPEPGSIVWYRKQAEERRKLAADETWGGDETETDEWDD